MKLLLTKKILFPQAKKHSIHLFSFIITIILYQMGNTTLAEELQQAFSSLDKLSGIAQKIEARFKELELKEAQLNQLEGVLNAKVKELEGREKRAKESEEEVKTTMKEREEKVKATMKEIEEKLQKWEEVEKQMAINAQKAKQVVTLNVGMCIFLYNIKVCY